ncbi:MAG: DUF748 domain-containing protein [Planctomycetota bacterium]|nr:MAG: DUF748 domain-containing protein [Planctomycetota bacterium]
MARQGQKKSRWRLRLFLFVLLLAVGVWFLPWIVTRQPIRGIVLDRVLSDFSGQVVVDDISAAWLSPVEVRGLRVDDQDGKRLLTLKQARSEKSLATLLLQGSTPGTFFVREPVIEIELREGGSNLEDLLAELREDDPAAPDEAASLPRPFALEVTEATIVLKNEAGATTTFSNVDLSLARKSEGTEATRPLSFQASGELSSADARPAPWSASGDVDPETGAAQATLKSEAVALAALEPLLTRFAAGTHADGMLAIDVELQNRTASDDQEPGLFVKGKLTGAEMQFASESLLAGDVVRLERLALDVESELREDTLTLQQCTIDSDVGRLTATGSFDLGRLSEGDLGGLLEDEEYEATGQIDLAKLANMIPSLLKVRPGTEFTSGELTVRAASMRVGTARRWQGGVETTNLQGLAQGRAVAWRQPVVANWQVTRNENGDLQARAECRSDFLEMEAQGTPVDATLQGQCDLGRLREALAQFLDLDSVQMGGRVAAELRIQETEAASATELAKVHANGRLTFADFSLQTATGGRWVEPNMEITVDATGRADTTRVASVEQAIFQLNTPGDHLRATLSEPVTAVAAETRWPLELEVRGDLASWYPRLQRMAVELPLEVEHVRGGVRGSLRGQFAVNRVAVQRADVELTQLDFAGSGYYIREPRVVLFGDATWEAATSHVRSDSTTLQTSAVSLRIDQLDVQSGENAPAKADGKITLAADLARLQRWFVAPDQPLTTQWAGSATARAELSHQRGATTALWEANMNDLVVAQPASTQLLPVRGGGQRQSNPWQTVWSEREVFLSGRGRHVAQPASIELDRLELSSDTLKLAETRGRIALAEEPVMVDIAGNVIYELEKITALLRPYLGSEIQLVGSGTRPFTIRGPIYLASTEGSTGSGADEGLGMFRDLTAQAGIGWSRASVYGMPVGEGELRAQLAQRMLNVDPLDLSLGQGRLRVAPRIDLRPQPSQLQVQPGRVIDQVRLSPEICQSWLKYVAPLLAEATRADGIFSLDLARCQVPLGETHRADVAGKLSIQSAQVRPGPVAEQLILVTQQIEAIVKKRPLASLTGRSQVALNVPAQEVDFEVRQGRVHHRNLALAIGDVQLRTTGSVGLDSTLQVVAEIPIQEDWVARDRHLRSLAGQSIRVPLRGTLSQPQLDRRALDDLTQQMLGSAAGGLIDDAINRGLEKGLDELFGR